MRPFHLAAPLAVLVALAPAAAFADDAPKPAAAAKPAAAPKPAASPKSAAPAAAPRTGKPATVASAKAPGKARATGKKKKGPQDMKVTGPVATYPGFRMLDGGGSRVLVSLSKKATVTEHKSEGKLTYRIQGVQVPTSTNRLPLLTGFFATPVTRIELVNREGDADLVIDVKGGASPTFRVIETDKGAELQVDFPKVAGSGDGDAKPAADAPQARPSESKSLAGGAGTAY